MKTLFTLLLSLSSISAFGQLEYSEIRSSIDTAVSYCGIRDTIMLERVYNKLKAFDITTISKGQAEYYEDLAGVEYELFMWYQDTSYLELSAINDEKAASFGSNNSAEWNAAFAYAFLGDCDKTKVYLLRFYHSSSKRDLRSKSRKDQISYLLEVCPDQELKELFKIKNATKASVSN